MNLNQLITTVVFFHWLKLCFSAIVLLMRSRIFFADFAYLGRREVAESAGRFVCEVRLVTLKCYECVFVGCSYSVHSVVDPQFRRDVFVFFMVGLLASSRVVLSCKISYCFFFLADRCM